MSSIFNKNKNLKKSEMYSERKYENNIKYPQMQNDNKMQPITISTISNIKMEINENKNNVESDNKLSSKEEKQNRFLKINKEILQKIINEKLKKSLKHLEEKNEEELHNINQIKDTGKRLVCNL